jgi:predicted nucleic acid-binding protein
LIVVDSSTLIDYLLVRRPAVLALSRALAERPGDPLRAPELIDLETLNVLRRLVRRGVVSVRRAEQAVADLGDVRLVRYRHAPLRERVWALRDRLTAYDASYLALAEGLEATKFLTGDEGLAAAARDLLGGERVELVP